MTSGFWYDSALFMYIKDLSFKIKSSNSINIEKAMLSVFDWIGTTHHDETLYPSALNQTMTSQAEWQKRHTESADPSPHRAFSHCLHPTSPELVISFLSPL